MNSAITAEFLAGLAGLILSLAFRYIPKLKDWYAAQPAQTKALVMAASLAVAAVAIYGASCTGLYPLGLVCGWGGVAELFRLFIAALVANQGTFGIVKNWPNGARPSLIASSAP